jgi:hypothetical protein
MEIQQMMECLLAKMDGNQAEMEATIRELRAHHEPLKEEMLAKLDANHERMMAKMDSQPEKMKACPGKTKATDLEANPEEIES